MPSWQSWTDTAQGGLDGRFLISRLKPTTFHIKSLTTIATPHRGSSYADWILKDVIGEKRIPALLKMCESIGVPGGGAAFEDLTVRPPLLYVSCADEE